MWLNVNLGKVKTETIAAQRFHSETWGGPLADQGLTASACSRCSFAQPNF